MAQAAPAAGRGLDVERLRADFPNLRRRVNGRRLVYLDSANTSQTPDQVVAAMGRHHRRHTSNVGRSVNTLALEATAAYEAARARVADFVGAASGEIVFAKNSTEAINLVAHAFGPGGTGGFDDPRLRLGPGDEVLVTEMEHHSNLIPWLLLCERTGARLRWIPLTGDGLLDLSDLDRLLNERTRLVTFVHVSNILGTVNPVEPIVRRAREVGALVLLDASQSVPHMPVDVAALGVDLMAFTGHKMCGPTGIGALWGRRELLRAMPPFLGGGSMIDAVSMTGATYAPPPARFEAGTPPIVQAVGLGAAVDYLDAAGMDAVREHGRDLTERALDGLASVPGLRLFGPPDARRRGGLVSFALDGIGHDDAGKVLDAEGVQVRVGRHCATPVCTRYGVPSMIRASFHLYTTGEEIDALVAAIRKVRHVLG
ncbi:aminotransferase class V-fold PLP-dependent enzyme [Actinomadura harenae]|uniref:aminotransferase class V-fold PLP-dependent enzyme n=1 Tax=Actinomadura harenae TaxID=2483351 RepID=UPI0018F31BFD|nr:SufS family cysteine desulfurase [Actinomadura harenae]